MKRLTALDLGFIYLEKRNQPFHVAYLNLLTPPADAPPDFVQKLVERLRSYAAPLPPFNQRLESRLGAAYWVDEPEFDIDQHVIHLSLPRPGRSLPHRPDVPLPLPSTVFVRLSAGDTDGFATPL